jgi:hypothetical protein
MSDILNDLLNEIDIQYEKISNSFDIDKRIAILELTRCLDHGFVYTRSMLKTENKESRNAREIYGFISVGFAACLKLFYDDSIKQLGCPFYPSNKEMIDWANSCLINSGHIAYTLRFIELSKQGLFSVVKDGENYKFSNTTIFPGLEQKSTEDFYWWQSQNALSEQEEIKLSTLKPKVEEDLFRETEIWNTFFIKYGCTANLDEYYELLGRHESRVMVGYDSFPDDAIFNGLFFREIKMIVEALIGYTLKHRDHCFTLLKKSNYTLNPWNHYTLPDLLTDLIESIVIHKHLPREKVVDFLNILTLDEKSIDRLAKIQGGAPPLLIKISSSHILKSMAGCLVNPFSFLTEALKSSYEKDYFNAVNYREAVFKNQLYSLFEASSIHKCDTNINLKNGNEYITDIDALLYDETNEFLLVVQLKWLDSFGGSMKMRSSMSKNFYSSSIKWVRNVIEWVNLNGEIELLKRIKSINAQKKNVKHLRLIVLGRNFSHFSDIQEEKNAIWVSWYTLQKAITTNPELKNDLFELANYLEKNSLEKGDFIIDDEQVLHVGKYTVTITI